jgi:WD40 repeat protein
LAIEDGVTTVAISPDNRFLAAGSLDKSVRVWELASGNLLERLEEAGGNPGHKDSVYSVAFSPTSRELVSGSLDRTIRMWELQSHYNTPMPPRNPRGGKCIRTFEGHKVGLFVVKVVEPSLTHLHRTLFSVSRFRLMVIGFCLDQKTEVSNSGTLRLATLNSCSRATKTRSSRLRPVRYKVVCLPLEVETCALEFGGSF